MQRIFVSAALRASLLLASGFAFAQEPPKAPEPSQAPGPQMPATPSMDQKGSDDMSKPAGSAKPAPTAHKGDDRKSKSPRTKVAKPHMSKRAVMTHRGGAKGAGSTKRHASRTRKAR